MIPKPLIVVGFEVIPDQGTADADDAVPVRFAVMVPALKLPDASLATIAEAVFALVAFEVTVNVAAAEPLYVVDPLKPVPDVFRVSVFKLLPNVIPLIVEAASLDTAIAADAEISALAMDPVSDNLLYAIAADAEISALTMVASAIIVDVTVPESPVVTTVPVVAGNVIVVAPAVAAGCRVTVPDVEPGIAILVIPVNARFAEALFSAIEVVPTNRDELLNTPDGIVPDRLPAGKLVKAAPEPETLVKTPLVAPILPTLALPVTLSDPNVPTEVILVWLAVSSVPAILVNTPLVAPILPTLALPVTDKVPSVPTVVILG